MTHVLILPQSATPWWPSIPIHEPMGAVLTHTTTPGLKSKRIPQPPPRLSDAIPSYLCLRSLVLWTCMFQRWVWKCLYFLFPCLQGRMRWHNNVHSWWWDRRFCLPCLPLLGSFQMLCRAAVQKSGLYTQTQPSLINQPHVDPNYTLFIGFLVLGCSVRLLSYSTLDSLVDYIPVSPHIPLKKNRD